MPTPPPWCSDTHVAPEAVAEPIESTPDVPEQEPPDGLPNILVESEDLEVPVLSEPDLANAAIEGDDAT